MLQQKHLFTGRWRNVTGAKPTREVAMQIALVAMLRLCLKPTVICRHVPNGELRDKRTAAKLKAMGILAGSADLEFFWGEIDALERKVFHAMFLELKLPGRKPTEAQSGFGLAMMTMGAEYKVVSSVEAAIELLGERGLIRPGVTVCGKRWDEYDGNADFAGSIDECYREIRERKAKGGKGWTPP